MKISSKSTLLLLSAFATLQANAQTTIMSGTNVKVLPGTQLSTGNMLISESASAKVDGTLNMASGDLTTYGDLDVIGKLSFTGSAIQFLEGAVPFEAGNVIINNGSGVVFNNMVTVNDSLNLVNGVLYPNSQTPIHFSATAKNPVETTNSHINGRAIMDDRTVGKNEMPLFLGVAITDGADLGVVSVDRITGDEGIITESDSNQSIASKWTIRTSMEPEFANRDIGFQWLRTFDNGNDITKLDLYGAVVGTENYEKLNDKTAASPFTDMRSFVKRKVGRFNTTFTLSDVANPLEDGPIGQKITRVFPNPFTDHITVVLENSGDFPVTAKMISATGYVAYQQTIPTVKDTFELKNLDYLPQGTYWLQLYVHGSIVSTQVVKIK
jgi:hypothetical protein